MYKVNVVCGGYWNFRPHYTRTIGSGTRPWRWTIILDWLFFAVIIQKIVWEKKH